MKALAFGEVLWDVYPDKAYIGGAPLNFAAHLSKHGEEVYMLTSFGNDDLGKAALDVLNNFGISKDYCAVLKNRETGKCLVTLDNNRVPSYNLLDDVAYDYIDCQAEFSGFDLLYFGTLALRSSHNFEALRRMIQENDFEEIFVDINIRKPHYSKETVSFAFESATIIKVSDEELPVVAELLNLDKTDAKCFAKGLSKKYSKLKYIVITRGDKGAYAYDTLNNQECECLAQKVDAVSTVGAGDSFSAAFVHKLFSGEALNNCLAYASRVAAFVVSNFDAIPDYCPDEI